MTYLTQLCAEQQVRPITREPVMIEPLIAQFRAAGIAGELRIVDETTGAIIIRFPLNEDPEEGDCQQPLPEA